MSDVAVYSPSKNDVVQACAFFREQDKEKCLECIDIVVKSTAVDFQCENALDLWKSILDKYQEQPVLLDPHLESLMAPIMDEVKRVVSEREAQVAQRDGTTLPFRVYQNPRLHKLFQMVYQLCKVRGAKTVVKMFPHEVVDLEPALHLLQSQDPQDYSTWETRYVLFLWLSMLCLVPFDLSSIDSSLGDSFTSTGVIPEERTLIGSIVTLCKNQLSDPGPTKEAASICLARLLTRPDMEAKHIRVYLEYVQRTLSQTISGDIGSTSVFLLTGILLSLAQISKLSHRENHRELVSLYVPQLIALGTNSCDVASNALLSNSLVTKLLMKVLQRVALTFLPPKVLNWRYMRGKRSLNMTFNASSQGNSSISTVEQQSQQQVADRDSNLDADPDPEMDMVPDEIEDIIEILLTGLRHSDTVVRWSAAKGLGRITGRLPFELADDVVESILELFQAHELGCAWHGAALAVAELARRGLLLPTRLCTLVPIIQRALVYDVRVGAHSVGAFVRDSACYMCWAVARAYSSHVLRPHMLALSQSMLIAAVFDREVNCRRAASAAFQENVGRQGHANFAHGIDIITLADYTSLGNRALAFTRISVSIGAYAAYFSPLLEHLITVKLVHWDAEIRALSAEAAGNFAPLNTSHMIHTWLPYLLRAENVYSTEVVRRHGTLLAIAEIVLSLSVVPCTIPGTVLKRIRAIVTTVDKKRLYRGKGGEMIRFAVCKLIESLAMAKIALSKALQLKYLAALEQCFKHPKTEIQLKAVDAYRAFGRTYLDHEIVKRAVATQFYEVLVTLRTQSTAQRLREDTLIETLRMNCTNRAAPASVLATTPRSIPLSSKLLDLTINSFINKIRSEKNVACRRGYCRALAACPVSLLCSSSTKLSEVVRTLINATEIEQDAQDRDAESRQAAVEALTEVVTTVGLCLHEDEGRIGLDLALDILRCFLACLTDYSLDNRGDVGSWVRKSAMKGLEVLVYGLTFLETKTETGTTVASSTERVNGSENENDDDSGLVRTAFGEGRVVNFKFRPCGSKAHLPSDVVDTDKLNNHDENLVLEVEFGRHSFGFWYFGSTHRGWIRAENVESASVNHTQHEMAFILPSMEERVKWVQENRISNKSSLSDDNRATTRVMKRVLTPEILAQVLNGLLKQMSEKLDVLRELAGEIFFRLLHFNSPQIPFVPMRNELETIFSISKEINFSSAQETFPLIGKLMDLPIYLEHTTSGLVISVGGLTESVVKQSSACLVSWMQRHIQSRNFGLLSNFSFVLLKLFETHTGDDRVIIPLMKTFGLLLGKDLFAFLHRDSPAFGKKLYEAVVCEVKKTSHIPKLLASITVLVGLLPSEKSVEKMAFQGLLVMLGHKLPRVRKATSEELYLRLTVHEQLVEEDKYDDALDILSETRWDIPSLKDVRASRDKLYALFGVEKKARSCKDSGEESKNTEEGRESSVRGPSVVTDQSGTAAEETKSSYQSLVKEMGY